MAEADRIAAALRYIDEQKPADPFASLKSDPIGALRSAWERKVDPIINNAKRTFATGGVLGDILRAYGEAGAPANRAVLKGMGMPYKEPAVVNTPPTLAPDNSYGNMGDTTAQAVGGMIGDPLNFVQPGAARIANALKFAKPDALKMLNEMSQGARSPMDVWHGSPHRFPPTAKNPLGEFDPTKIGTGEGAQAYGHGHYLAEAKGVGKGYQDALQTTDTLLNGKKVFPIDPNFSAASSISANGYDTALAMARRGATEQFLTPEGRAHSAALAKQIEALKGAKIKNAPSGSLYKVDLPDAQIAKMLDWDKPLSGQSWFRPVADVVKEYKGAGKDVDAYARLISKANSRGGEVTGAQLYEGMLSQFGGSQAKVSEFMREAGIPGIRYLDQGSRGAGQGTSNFVVFPGGEGRLNILGRE